MNGSIKKLSKNGTDLIWKIENQRSWYLLKTTRHGQSIRLNRSEIEFKFNKTPTENIDLMSTNSKGLNKGRLTLNHRSVIAQHLFLFKSRSLWIEMEIETERKEYPK